MCEALLRPPNYRDSKRNSGGQSGPIFSLLATGASTGSLGHATSARAITSVRAAARRSRWSTRSLSSGDGPGRARPVLTRARRPSHDRSEAREPMWRVGGPEPANSNRKPTARNVLKRADMKARLERRNACHPHNSLRAIRTEQASGAILSPVTRVESREFQDSPAVPLRGEGWCGGLGLLAERSPEVVRAGFVVLGQSWRGAVVVGSGRDRARGRGHELRTALRGRERGWMPRSGSVPLARP